MSKTIRETIGQAFEDVCAEQDIVIKHKVDNELVLLNSGLDSLGFAILVAELENRLGYDPFVLMDTPVYPRTMGEFVAMYERFADHAKPNMGS